MLFRLYKNEIEVKRVYSVKLKKNARNIGIVSDWHWKGVPYQSRFLSKCLSGKFNVHIFAYNDIKKDEDDWGYSSLVFTKKIRPWKLLRWIKNNAIKVVFFPDRLEEERVLDLCRKNCIATVMIINYETIKKEEFLVYRKYSKLWCPVKCTQDLLKKNGIRNSHFIRWGIDNNMFSPKKAKITFPIRYFHNAGYGGVEWRKNTLAVVDAFDMASKKNNKIRLILKTQKPIKEYPNVVQEIIKKNPNIIINEKDLKMSDLIKLYRSCHISILPSKWEGIGIPFIESLSIGLPVITVDAPPMNEWVKNGYNGCLAKVAKWERRHDKQILIKGAMVNVEELSKCILRLSDPGLIAKLRANAIKSVRKSKKKFIKEVERFTKKLCEK